ncbi:MAG TPA: hypothetical protein VN923_14140, partial [Thermoanaerobaculia bacterium]|nr:hypothetical protein [Thermoanaerobaculia bacterium]
RALLAPLAVVWLLVAGASGAPLRRRLAGLLLAAASAAPVAVLLYPWLWPSPWQRVLEVVTHVRSFDLRMPVLYLGELYWPNALPWHYGLVSLLIATPVPLLIAALAGIGCALRGGPAARLCRLAALWLGLFLLADLLAPARYDGARHLLPALPALALLAASGVYAVAMALARSTLATGAPIPELDRSAATPSRREAPPPTAGRRALLVLGVVFAATLLVLSLELAAIHPYADAYLNAPARWLLGPEAQHQVELEYWGSSYKEGAEWLARHAPPGAFVLVPIGAHAAAPSLVGRFELVPHDGWRDGSRPQYLMVITREAWYSPRLRQIVATQRPLFTVRRQGSTLLAIYRVAPLDAAAGGAL